MPRSLASRFTSLSAPRRCIGCGDTLSALAPRGRPCGDCRARFAIHDPELVVSAWQACQIVLLVPLVATVLFGGLALLAVLPHLIMVWLGLGPLGFLLYFPVLALGARLGRWLEENGLRETAQRAQTPARSLR
ncbi:MAG: hypothetical protein RIM84_21730 [Alphaproteobacteria bacterium]